MILPVFLFVFCLEACYRCRFWNDLGFDRDLNELWRRRFWHRFDLGNGDLNGLCRFDGDLWWRRRRRRPRRWCRFDLLFGNDLVDVCCRYDLLNDLSCAWNDEGFDLFANDLLKDFSCEWNDEGSILHGSVVVLWCCSCCPLLFCAAVVQSVADVFSLSSEAVCGNLWCWSPI